MDTFHVVVIGAGVSGLACARTLREEIGVKDVLVLEANERIGGRVYPKKFAQDGTLFHGMDMEIGAEFIHGDTTVLHDYAREEGWKLRQIFIWAHGDGGPAEEPAPDGGCGYYYDGYEKKYMRFDGLDEDLEHMSDVLNGLRHVDEASKKKMATWNLERYLRENGVSRKGIAMAKAGYANTLGSSLGHLSVPLTCRLEKLWDDDGDDIDYRFIPSSQVLLDKLAGKDWSNYIRTGSAVKRIVFDKRRQVNYIHYEDYLGGHVIEAKHVVVTVPVQVLSSPRKGEALEFDPPLPKAKVAAIKSIRVRGAMKIVAKFSRRFWPENMHGTICGDCLIPEFWQKDGGAIVDGHGNVLESKRGDLPNILVGFAMAGFHADLKGFSESEILGFFVRQLDEIFGNDESSQTPATDSFIGGFVFDWEEVPFIRGGYSFPSVYETPEARQLYCRSENDETLHFAGEATDYEDAFMTMHCAIRTGENVARKIGSQRSNTSKL